MRLLNNFFKSSSDFPKNFLYFGSDTIEKQGIIDLSSYSSKYYASVVLSDSEIAFLGKGKYAFKFFCLLYFRGYYVEDCSVSALNFSNTASSSPSVISLSLMYWRPLIFLDRFSVISGGFLSRFLKCSFHFWSLCSWLSTFSFALEVLFLPLILFTVCYANRDCLSFPKFQILLIWHGIYLNSSFWYVLVISGLS